jgi:hypothetical protein
VVSLCSKARHIPASARAAEPSDESDQTWSRVLDLHTVEMPIHNAAMPETIKLTGLLGLCDDDGVLEIYAVHRHTTPVSNVICAGKYGVYRACAYWYPPTKQSDRGMAMFLAALRVTAGLFQEEEDSAAQDALLHVFDLMSAFPPALRSLHLLDRGKTPSPSECAALGHSCFHILEKFMPEDLIGNTRQRLFEGSRLLFGFLLKKARSVKLHESQLASPQNYPYLGALQVIEARDCIISEALMDPVLTGIGFVEKAFFDAFATAGILSSSTMQSNLLSRGSADATLYRRAMLCGGTRPEISAFCRNSLISNYTYADDGSLAQVMDESELHDLHYLAELCGRNKPAVHKPSQLTSAIAPCLTFDRNAHVAAYLGEQGCGEPGRSSLVFRPLTGITETPDAAVVEQLIEPIIKTYEAEGTSVFDNYGGAAVRKMEAPDEILMFCVDFSASMR